MRTLIALTFALSAVGCARATSTPASHAPSSAETLAAKISGKSIAQGSRGAAASSAAIASAELRKPGDFVVFRFSGSFRKDPLLLSQKVVSVDGPMVTVDVVLAPEAEGKRVSRDARAIAAHLRVVFDKTPGAVREVAKVTRIVGDREEPGTLEEYEKLMAETIVVPDRNDDMLGTEIATANVGDKKIECKKTSYRVAFGKKTAVMSTLTSDGFAWGDVGGEIKSDGGKVIYRAEIIEMGRGEPTATAAR